jgi:hypothetical protein
VKARSVQFIDSAADARWMEKSQLPSGMRETGFDDAGAPDPTDPKRRLLSNGRGIYLIQALMDEVRFEKHGNVVHMRKKLRTAFEIEASLPKLNKNGRLRAIRRTLSAHDPEYQVLEMSGDSMVKHQLIVRYLDADKRAAELSNASTAITPANYKVPLRRRRPAP